MNNWLAWALPLVALGVWILSNLIKNAQEEARRRDMRPKPPNPEQADNAQRREPPRKIERPRPPVRSQPAPVARPQPAPPRPMRLPTPEPTRVVRRSEPAEQIVVGQLVETAAVVVPATVAASVSVPKSNKAVQNLKALLKTKNTMATAFLLTEVFGKPRCKR